MSDIQKTNILICEDQDGVREAYKLILEDTCNIIFADNGLQGLDYLKKNTPDIIFLDIRMPKMNGIEALKVIRKKHKDIPVVVISGYHGTEIEDEAKRVGASAYVGKPFASKDILDTVATYATKRK